MSHELFAHAGFAAEDEAAADASARAQYEYEARQEEERIGGEQDEGTQGQRVEAADQPQGLGLVAVGNKVEGQQVLGTCSPADTITYSALLSRLQRIHDARITSPEKDAVEACMNEVRALLGGGS